VLTVRCFNERMDVNHKDILTFRHYWTGDCFVSEGRRTGFDPPKVQMKELCELMAKAVPDDGSEIEVVMTVRPT
jgi:hypothetical protein